MFKKVALFMACAVSAFAMHSVELNINDKDLELGAKIDVAQFSENVKPQSVYIGFRFLHADEAHSDVASNKSIDDYYEVNFLMQREIESSNLYIGLGVKLNGTESFASVPLGLEVAYKIPLEKLPMQIRGSVYYAPEVLSMRDAQNFVEYRVDFEAEVIENASVLLGARSIDTDYSTSRGDINYNRSFYLGFKFSF